MPKKQDFKGKALVKMLHYVLGVAPGEFGLVPDEQGSYELKELIKALHQEAGWRGVRESMIRDASQRVAPGDFLLGGKRIKSVQRTPPEPRWDVETPPHLYYGARQRGYAVIRQRGLSSGPKGPVILSADEGQALKWGKRRDREPVLVTVQADQAREKGAVFALLNEVLYFCEQVPASCLMGPAVPERSPEKKRSSKEKPSQDPFAQRMPRPEEMPGSFLLDSGDVEKPYKRKGLKKEIKWKDERRKGRRGNKKGR